MAAAQLELMRASLKHTPGGKYVFVGDRASGVLGTGGHGMVLLARAVDSGEMVAVKVVSVAAEKALGKIATEIAAQGTARHRYVVDRPIPLAKVGALEDR